VRLDPDGSISKKFELNLVQMRSYDFRCYEFRFDYERFCIASANVFAEPDKYNIDDDFFGRYFEHCGTTLVRILCLIDMITSRTYVPFMGWGTSYIGEKIRVFMIKATIGTPTYPEKIIRSGFNGFPDQIKYLINKVLEVYEIRRMPRQKIKPMPIGIIKDENSNRILRWLGTAIFIIAFLCSGFAVLGENLQCIFSFCHFPILNYSLYLTWTIAFGIISTCSLVIIAIRTLSTDKFQRKIYNSNRSFLSLILVGHADLQEKHENITVVEYY
jgi:hypothetical protein